MHISLIQNQGHAHKEVNSYDNLLIAKFQQLTNFAWD